MGKFADELARQLSATGEASMICLANVAIGNQPLIIQQIKVQNWSINLSSGT